MDWLMIVLMVSVGILILAVFILSVILRGALRVEDDRSKSGIKALTGREIEFVRRKLVNIGLRGITLSEAFSLVKTLRDIQLGLYTDEDPWIPADPYEDIDKEVNEI